MALGIYSGKDAFVTGVNCVQSWQATEAVAAQRYTASCTPGGSNVAPGISNWTGSMQGIGLYPSAVIPDGNEAASFVGTINNTAGQGDLLSLNGTICIEQLTIDFNKEASAPISWQCSFGFQGIPTTAATGAADSSSPLPHYADGLDIGIGASLTTIASASCCIRSAQIVLRRQTSTYVKNGATYRKSGHLECDVNFSVYCPNLFTAAYAANVLDLLKISAGYGYWQFSKIRFLGKSNLQVDRTSNAVIGYTVNGQWNAYDATTESAGYIVFYDGTSGSEAFYPIYGVAPE